MRITTKRLLSLLLGCILLLSMIPVGILSVGAADISIQSGTGSRGPVEVGESLAYRAKVGGLQHRKGNSEFLYIPHQLRGLHQQQSLPRQLGVAVDLPAAVCYASAADKASNTPEQISVGVAQNHDAVQNKLAAMNGHSIMGRSYTSEGYHYEDGAKVWGYNFAEQFGYALEIDPKVIFVTGWNEWTASRHEIWPKGSTTAIVNAFPDTFNDEYSRDLEPSKGDLKDHYYYQLVNFARRYKGANPIPTPSENTVISLYGGHEQWATVEPYYVSYIGTTEDRNAQGYGQTYTETSGRNDIIGAQVARNQEYVYFLVECAENITPYTDKLWMNLYINTDQSKQGWNTFEYVLNKSAASEKTLVLEKFTGDNDYTATEKVADVEYTVSGKYLTVKIAKADLGIAGHDFTINFAWTDNVHDEGDKTKFSGDIMDFYISGDIAPGGRFKYSFVSTRANAGIGEEETFPETAEIETPATDTDQEINETDTPGTTPRRTARPPRHRFFQSPSPRSKRAFPTRAAVPRQRARVPSVFCSSSVFSSLSADDLIDPNLPDHIGRGDFFVAEMCSRPAQNSFVQFVHCGIF